MSDGTLEPLEAVEDVARRVSRESFVATRPGHWLVVGPFAPLDRSGAITVVGAGRRTSSLYVAKLGKRAGSNALAGMVTVGRASTNDVILRDETASKFHAYFQTGSDGKVTFVDAGSSNGSSVNGERVQPKTDRRRLEAGDEVRFGELRSHFHDAASLWDYLRTRSS